jgi:sulfate transport system ATP-binding protein/putative spermidine/putrescine transport system ATP-binding protein
VGVFTSFFKDYTMSHVRNLKKAYDNFFLEVLDLEIPDEGLTVVQGPSGSGKSSFLRILMGLDVCREMSWVFQGQDLAKLRPQDRKLGVVFQSLELFPHMTAYENIYFHAQARKISKSEFNERMKKFFEISKMQPHLHKKVELLSGGEQQRVALLRAIAGKPQILLLDEPFSALDIQLKQELKKLLLQILETEKIPCVLVSHDPEDEKVAQKIVRFSNGTVLMPSL